MVASSGSSALPLGLIAGDGALPGAIARAARGAGRRVVAVAFVGITDSRLGQWADEVVGVELGQLDAMLGALADAGVAEAVLAGKVSKEHWLRPGGGVPVRPDARALELLSRLEDRRDDALLGALAACLEDAGIRLLSQARLVPELLPGPGPLGRLAPSPELWRDVACGWRAAKGIAGLDLGQTAVVREGAVVALEAVEGTDEAIRRGGRLGGAGATAVKVAKPAQDPRFDMPTIGTGTLGAAREAGLACLAFEAGATLVLDREALAEQADRQGLALVGVPATGPQASASAGGGGAAGGGDGDGVSGRADPTGDSGDSGETG
ncbi:MAG: LpxI family protein [Myxococcota bacterium]